MALHDLGGSGPPLLLTHATGMHGLVYVPLALGLMDRFHCWALDLRGHGDSTSAADERFGWDRFALDILAAVRHLGSEGIIGFGHSMGGAAMVIAAQSAPGAFRHLFLYEPALLPPGLSRTATFGTEKIMMVEGARRRRSTFATRADAIQHYASKGPLSSISAAALHAYVMHGFEDAPDGGIRIKCAPAVESAVFAQTESQEALGLWSGLQIMHEPIDLFYGTRSGGHHAETAQSAAAELRGTAVALEGLEHFGPMQLPGHVAEALGRRGLNSP